MGLQQFLSDTAAVLWDSALKAGVHSLQQRYAELQTNCLAQKTRMLRWMLSAALALLLLTLGLLLTISASLMWCWIQHGPLATAVMGLFMGLVLLGLGAWLLERNRSAA